MPEEEKITAFQMDMVESFLKLNEELLEKHGFFETIDSRRCITDEGVIGLERFLICSLVAHIESNVKLTCKKQHMEEVFKIMRGILDELNTDNA